LKQITVDSSNRVLDYRQVIILLILVK